MSDDRWRVLALTAGVVLGLVSLWCLPPRPPADPDPAAPLSREAPGVQPLANPPVLLPGHSGIPNGIPNPCATPTIETVASGAWTAPATWNLKRVPQAGDRIYIRPGHTIGYTPVSDLRYPCLNIDGTLQFNTTASTRLRVDTLIVLDQGALEIGTPAMPVLATATAELYLGGQAFNPTADPEQFWGGLIGIGRVTMHGHPLTPTFVGLTTEVLTGNGSLPTISPVSWRAGDELVVPDTRALLPSQRFTAYVSWSERPRVASVTGTTVVLDRQLTRDHRSWRDGGGAERHTPWVANLTRNVRILSDNPAVTRAHTLFTHRAVVDLRYVEVRGLGRTTLATLGASNLAGRYPLHIHHLMGPVNPANTGYQYTLIGNAIVDSLKWPLTIHNSHYGLIRDNVVAYGDGWGYGTEDGNESYNEFVHNFGTDIVGNVDARQQDGRTGDCMWFMGFNHIVTDNVMMNCHGSLQSVSAGSGYSFNAFPADHGATGNQRIPTARGLDTALAGNFVIQNRQCHAINRFERNLMMGGALGLTVWNLGIDGYAGNQTFVPTCPNQPVSTIRDFVAVNTWSGGFFGYPAYRMVFDGYLARSIPGALFGCGFWGDDYKLRDITIRNADVQGFPDCGIEVGEGTEGTLRIENYTGRNAGSNLRIWRFNTPGTGATVRQRILTVVNLRASAWPGSNPLSIEKVWSGTNQTNVNTLDQSDIYQYQGVVSDNFRLYFVQQGTQHIQGAQAPCQTQRPGIGGIACVIPPLATPGAPRVPVGARLLL
jgi:hypothetical protein